MSLLMYTSAPESVWVVTDTLATDGTAGRPFLFTSKCSPVPHMRMLIAGTGIAALTDRWRDIVQTRILALDAPMLDLHAPGALRTIWVALAAENELAEQTATVYHFGYDAEKEEHRTFVYRSSSNFESEYQVPAFAVKPGPDGDYEPPNDIDQIIALADRIRTEQAALPEGERIYIGGELVLTTLTGDTSAAQVIYRFPDFVQDWQAMNGQPVPTAPSGLT